MYEAVMRCFGGLAARVCLLSWAFACLLLGVAPRAGRKTVIRRRSTRANPALSWVA